MAAAWSSRDVVMSLMRSTHRWRDRVWIASYFGGRKGPARLRGIVGRHSGRDGALVLDELATPLHVRADTGGLATYYEIVSRRVYSPDARFEPATGQTVVDVGANIGVFSLWAASRVGPTGRVLAIEPNPEAFAVLAENLAPFEFVELQQVACGAEPASLELHYPPGRLSVGSLRERPDRTISVKVDVHPLDELTAGIDHVSLLKIDVEGVEREVLEGARETLARSDRLVMELDSDQVPDVTNVMKQAGLDHLGTIRGMWGLTQPAIAHFCRASQ